MKVIIIVCGGKLFEEKYNVRFIFVLILVFSISAIDAEDFNDNDLNLTAADENVIQIENETPLINTECENSNSLSADDSNNKNQTELISPSNSIYYKGDYSISLKDSNSTLKLSNKTISFVINNIQYNSTTNNDGIASVNLNLAPGKYDVSASFEGDDLFAPCNFTSNFQILPTVKAVDMSKYYKGSAKYSATFYNSQGIALANRWVTITVNGKSYNQKTNNNGVASLDVNLKPGNYKIVSTDPVTGYKLTTNFNILSTISSNNVNKVIGDSKKFTVKFMKNNGRPLSKQYIKFKIKGKPIKLKQIRMVLQACH